MNRREYLQQALVLSGAVGVAGCGLLGGGDAGTSTPETDAATGTVDLNDSTPEDAESVSEELSAALDAKDDALATFEDAAYRVGSLGDSPDYKFQGRVLAGNVSELQSALSDVESGDTKATLQTLANYLETVATVLDTTESAIESLGPMVETVFAAGIIPSGVDEEATLRSIDTQLEAAVRSLSDVDDTREGFAADGTALTTEDVETIDTAHETLSSKITAVRGLVEGMRKYLEGTGHYVDAEEHRRAAEEAGENRDAERLDEEITAAQRNYGLAETLFAEGRTAIESVDPGVQGSLQTRVSRIECRVGALETASKRWQEFAQMILDREPRSDIEAKEAQARDALDQCATE